MFCREPVPTRCWFTSTSEMVGSSLYSHAGGEAVGVPTMALMLCAARAARALSSHEKLKGAPAEGCMRCQLNSATRTVRRPAACMAAASANMRALS